MGVRTAVETIRAAVAAMNAGDIDGYLAHFDPGCSRWVPGLEQALSLRDVGDNLIQLRAGIDDLHLHEELLFGDDSHACARWRLSGRHVRECYGIEPTGATIDVPTCEVYELSDGVVTNSWVYGNPAVLFDQLAASPGAPR
jgi:predicted ester cyclase